MNKFEKKVTESQILEQPLAINHELEIVAKGAGIAFSGKVIGTGVKFITQVLIARLLGSKLLGIYSLGIVIHEVAALFSRIGLLHGALRYVSIHHGMEDSRRLKGVLVYAICLPWLGGLIIGTGLFLTSGYVAREVFGKPELALVLRVFSIALPFWASIIVTARSTTGFQTTKYLVYIKEYFQPLMNLLLVVVLCSIGLGLFGATLAWTLSVILGLAIAIYFVGKIFPPFLQKDVKPVFEGKKLIKYSLPLVFGELLVFILFRVDTLMLGYFRSASEVGVYHALSQTSLIVIIFYISFVNIFAPFIADLFNKGEKEKMSQLFKDVARWNFSLTMPLFLIIIIGGQDILHLFGPDFKIGWIPLIILSAGQLVSAGTGGVSLMLVMSGHQYLKVFGDFALVVTNVSLNIFLIPKWGILGAAAATAISIAGVSLLMVILVYRTLNIHPYSWSYLKAIGAGAVAAIIGFIILQSLPSIHPIPSLMFKAATMILAYIALLCVMHFEESDKFILRKIRERLIRL